MTPPPVVSIPPQHAHPDTPDQGVLNCGGQPADRPRQGVPGRAADDKGQPPAGRVRVVGHPARPAWHADRGHIRD